MASTPANELAQEILDSCLSDGTWPARTLDALIERALDDDNEFLARAATRALFGIIIERLGDLFEPSLCDVYARLFSHVISRALPEYDAHDLVLRYGRVRQVRRFLGGQVRRVFVLSRVTLGADVAVTSMALAAAKQRFPEAEVLLVGPAKNAEMFAADPQVTALTVMYARSNLCGSDWPLPLNCKSQWTSKARSYRSRFAADSIGTNSDLRRFAVFLFREPRFWRGAHGKSCRANRRMARRNLRCGERTALCCASEAGKAS